MATRLSGRLPARWRAAVLVCAKCSKRAGGGFGPKRRTPLAKALRRHLKAGKGRRSRFGIVDVKCLGVCPRDAITVVNAATPDEWLLVTPGADLDALTRELGLDPAMAPAQRMTF